jgi:hypothetical protein
MKNKIKQLARKHKTTIIWTGLGVTSTALVAAKHIAKMKYGAQIQQVDVYSNNDQTLLTIVFSTVAGHLDSIDVPITM